MRLALVVATAALSACGGSAAATSSASPTISAEQLTAVMQEQIAADLPAKLRQVLVGDGIKDAAITNPKATCVLESLGSATVASHFTCEATYFVTALAERVKNQQYQVPITASSDASGRYEWQFSGTPAAVG